jgi:hypothetical protein
MIIIFGRRQYGKVDGCGSEYAHTTFGHLYYMPIIPVSSFWVTHEAGNQRSGYPIPLHGKSVLAAYLRMWGPVAAVIALASGSLTFGVPIAVGIAALSAWAWTWRSIRGAEAVRRTDFNRLAFGMRCEPTVIHAAQRVELEQNLRARWERLGTGRSPNDVGRFGATDPGEAVTAYGLLRLAAISHKGKDEHEAAERILRGMHDKLPAEDGPYREAATPAAADVHEQIAAAAQTIEARRNGAANAAAIDAARKKAPGSRARAMIVGSLIMGAVAAGGLLENAVPAFGTPAHGTIPDVIAAHTTGDYVTIDCPKSIVAGELAEGSHTTKRVFICASNDVHLMAVTSSADVETLGTTVTGKLMRAGYEDSSWWSEISSEDSMEPLYLELSDASSERAQAFVCIGLAVAALGLLGFGLHTRRRAKTA